MTNKEAIEVLERELNCVFAMPICDGSCETCSLANSFSTNVEALELAINTLKEKEHADNDWK